MGLQSSDVERDTLSKESDRVFCEAFDFDVAPEILPADVTAVVLCHNEALRLPDFLAHHKAAGVGRFIVIDNESNDGSAEILDADSCVIRLPSAKPYSSYKSIWRHLVADRYLQGRWCLFIDVDELLVYPGWPDVSLPEYLSKVEQAGFEGLFTIMVDMYPECPLSEFHYDAGTSMIEAAPFFDVGNYRMEPYTPKQLRDYPTPPVQVRGGARERIFHAQTSRERYLIDDLLVRIFFNLRRKWTAGRLRRKLDSYARNWLHQGKGGLGLPNMSKIPLLKWRKGYAFHSGVHRLNTPIAVASDIVAFLHFKYLDDFTDRSAYFAERGQHTQGGAHYKLYTSQSDKVADKPLTCSRSARFTGVKSLERAGLVQSNLPGSV